VTIGNAAGVVFTVGRSGVCLRQDTDANCIQSRVRSTWKLSRGNQLLHRMRTILLLILCSPIVMFAQHEYDVWHFGENAGLEFSSTGVKAIRGFFSTQEGSASICNRTTGALLFSTDGIILYDRSGSSMPNGRGLLGGWSSTQSALIIPMPGDTSKYYVFTPGDLSNNGQRPGLAYSVVDMTLNNGMGDVTVKNVRLLDSCAEKLTATLHCDGQSWWVVAHAMTIPRFYVYRVDADGVHPPIVRNVGEQYTVEPGQPGREYGLGYIKFSPEGTLLAMASPHAAMLELFSFDIGTGDINTPRTVRRGLPFYGIAFSPSGSMLYGTTWSSVWQFPTLTSYPPVAGIELGPIPSYEPSLYRGGIQCGPDGRIYVADGANLRVVQYPERYGQEAVYTTTYAVPLDGGIAVLGMPNVTECLYDRSRIVFCGPPIAGILADTAACVGSCLTIRDATERTPTKWEWTFTGGTPGVYDGRVPPPVCYSTPGTYAIRLVVSNSYGADTTTRTVRVVPLPIVDAGPDVELCDSSYGRLHASGAERYEWEPDIGISSKYAPDPIVRVFSTTIYRVKGYTAEGCVSEDVVTVHYRTFDPTISGSTELCRGMATRLTVSEADSVLWSPSDGVSDPRSPVPLISPDTTTTYVVDIWSGACHQKRTVTVTVRTGAGETDTVEARVICEGDAVVLTAPEGQRYRWESRPDIADPAQQSVTVRPVTTTTYTVTVFAANGCSSTIVFPVTVYTGASGTDTMPAQAICEGDAVMLTAPEGTRYEWIPGPDIDDPTQRSVTVRPLRTTSYSVRVYAASDCSRLVTFPVTVTSAATARLAFQPFQLEPGQRSTIELRATNPESFTTFIAEVVMPLRAIAHLTVEEGVDLGSTVGLTERTMRIGYAPSATGSIRFSGEAMLTTETDEPFICRVVSSEGCGTIVGDTLRGVEWVGCSLDTRTVRFNAPSLAVLFATAGHDGIRIGIRAATGTHCIVEAWTPDGRLLSETDVVTQNDSGLATLRPSCRGPLFVRVRSGVQMQVMALMAW